MAAKETNRLAASFANCSIYHSRVGDGFNNDLVGTLSSIHPRADVCTWAAGALDRCYSRGVVLFREIILAGKPHVHLSAVTVNPNNPLSYIWLVAGIVLCVAIYFARRYVGRSVEVAAAFFVVTLSPVLGFIMLYTFRYTFVADHYQYLACIGPIALVSAGLVKLTNSVEYGPRVLFALGILIFTTLGLVTWRQSANYRDRETLWRITIDRNPGCWMAETNLGSELSEGGDFNGAIAHLEKSLRLKFDAPEAHNSLTYALFRKGDADAAIAEAHVAMNFDPNNADT